MNRCTKCKEELTDNNRWNIHVQMPKNPHPVIVGSLTFCSLYCMEDLTVGEIMNLTFKKYSFIQEEYEKILKERVIGGF